VSVARQSSLRAQVAAVDACLRSMPSRADALCVPTMPFARMSHADAMRRFGVDKVRARMRTERAATKLAF
jgi:aspartyl-tRNA synthetase